MHITSMLIDIYCVSGAQTQPAGFLPSRTSLEGQVPTRGNAPRQWGPRTQTHISGAALTSWAAPKRPEVLLSVGVCFSFLEMGQHGASSLYASP